MKNNSTENAPFCQGCKSITAVVKADAGLTKSIPYWYCRTCKIEVFEITWTIRKPENEENSWHYQWVR